MIKGPYGMEVIKIMSIITVYNNMIECQANNVTNNGKLAKFLFHSIIKSCIYLKLP